MEISNRINFKLFILLVISIASLFIFYFAEDKESFINFFFLPVLLTGYAYDSKGGIISALLSIAFVMVIAFLSFDNYMEFITKKVFLWGCFLVIAGYIIGKLSEKINSIYLGTITTLALAMESRDPYTHGHSYRVAEVSARIAQKLGLSKTEQNIIKTAGMLHDIGKFGIKEEVLQKEDPLTTDEYDHIRQHPLIGASILSPVKLLRSIIPLIYYHHEHFDGTGYLHKSGSEIPIASRIIAVADAYDAMTMDRPYRKAMQREEILKVFEEESGKQFDKKIVDILLKITDNLRISIGNARIDLTA